MFVYNKNDLNTIISEDYDNPRTVYVTFQLEFVKELKMLKHDEIFYFQGPEDLFKILITKDKT